jgi:hypothetical protein
MKKYGGNKKNMFYCDHCAEKNKYPIWADERMKNYGSCEICNKTTICSDIQQDIIELGLVKIYFFEKSVFLNPEEQSFYAPKGKCRVVGFNLEQIRQTKNMDIVPVNHTEDFKDKEKAIEHIKQLRKDHMGDENQQYFLFNENGYMQEIN